MMKHWFSDVKSFRRDPLTFFREKGSQANAPIVQLHLGPKRVWYLTDADLVKTVLKAPESQFDKGRFIHKLKSVVGTSSLTISGEKHRSRRQALHQTFARGAASQFVPQMSAAIRSLVPDLLKEDSFNAHEVSARLTLKMICIAMFGKNVLTTGDEQAVLQAVSLVEDDLADEMFRVMPLTPWAALVKRKKRAQAHEIMDFVVNRVCDRAAPDSAVTALINLGLTPIELRDEIVTLLLAGHHTTGAAAAWLLYYLATVPDLTENLANEANALSDDGGELAPHKLPKASLSLSVVKEVLRLYPSAYWFSRDAKRTCQLGDVTLRAGDAIIISPWHLHRDERYWKNPDQFSPDRSFSGRAYLPFGAGPRACLGLGIATLELQLLALELSAVFDFELRNKGPVGPPIPSVMLIPPEIRLSIRPRKKSFARVAAE